MYPHDKHTSTPEQNNYGNGFGVWIKNSPQKNINELFRTPDNPSGQNHLASGAMVLPSTVTFINGCMSPPPRMMFGSARDANIRRRSSTPMRAGRNLLSKDVATSESLTGGSGMSGGRVWWDDGDVEENEEEG